MSQLSQEIENARTLQQSYDEIVAETNKIGTPGTGQPQTLFEAILQAGGMTPAEYNALAKCGTDSGVTLTTLSKEMGTDANDYSVQEKLGTPEDAQGTQFTVCGKLADISTELGNLSAIFSGITAQDITDEYNAE